MNKLLVKFDYFVHRNYHLLPMKFWNHLEFPTKRLLNHCWTNWNNETVKHKYEMISHMYAYDSTVTKDDLSLVHTCYGPMSKERIRQLLAKFVRMYYRGK